MSVESYDKTKSDLLFSVFPDCPAKLTMDSIMDSLMLSFQWPKMVKVCYISFHREIQQSPHRTEVIPKVMKLVNTKS